MLILPVLTLIVKSSSLVDNFYSVPLRIFECDFSKIRLVKQSNSKKAIVTVFI